MQADATPAELFGPLLSRVQESGILRDGKVFVDAVPRRPVGDIMADFRQHYPRWMAQLGEAGSVDFQADVARETGGTA